MNTANTGTCRAKKERQRKDTHMLDWLKPILGEGYNDELDGKISAAIGQHFVSKKDFNDLNETKKSLEKTLGERDTQLEGLKASSGDATALRAEIEKLQGENKAQKEAHEAELAKIKLDGKIADELKNAGAKNITAVKAIMANFLDSAKIGEDGDIPGLSDEIEKMVKNEETAFLFDTKGSGFSFKGISPGDPGGVPPPASSGDYASKLNEARKNGDTLSAVAIKREAAENGVFLI